MKKVLAILAVAFVLGTAVGCSSSSSPVVSKPSKM